MACRSFRTADGMTGMVCGPKERKPKEKWPKSVEEMKTAGWKSSGWGKCRACPAKILWAAHPKTGTATPLIEITPGYWQPHHIDCPARAQFRRKKA